MTREPSRMEVQANMLSCGYNMGYYSETDIELWAERQIDQLDEPPLVLIELATSRGVCPIDIMNRLNSLCDRLSPMMTI